MDLTENWKQLVEQHNEKAIIPFLQQLDEAKKNTLLPCLSKTAKDFLEIKDRLINNKHFYAKKASGKQERILNYSIFVIATDPKHPVYKWLDVNKIVTLFTVDNILNWYCPKWFNNYIDDFSQQEFLPLNLTYDLVQTMSERGYISPTKELLAKLLTRIIFPELPDKKYVYHFRPQNLLDREITLEEHFWYIFEYETQIYSTDRHLNIEDRATLPDDSWFYAIKKYVEEGKINRLRILKACLTATTKSVFNKPAAGWFASLFNHITPTNTELLKLQNELFSTFHIPFTKATNTALKAIKKIVKSDDFEVDNCLKGYEKLLVSKTKSVVTNALFILEKLAAKFPEKQKLICTLAAQSFVHREENLQVKAAKIIQKYGGNNQAFLKKAIQPYVENLYQSSKGILTDSLIPHSSQKTDNQPFNIKIKKLICKDNQIPAIDTFEIFHQLSLQIFNNNQPYHFDQFLAALIKFQDELSGKNIEKFTPIFKRAYQLVFNELPSHQGMIDNILAIFLLDLADLLLGKYPADCQSLRKIADAYLEQGFFINEEGTPFDLHYANLYRWYNPYDPSQVYMPFKKLLGAVLTFLHEEKAMPLLSTPTHAPTWIDPVILVEKLAIYQEKKQTPDPIDLQLAISRIAFENKSKALLLAQQKLDGDPLELMLFLLTPKAEFPIKFKAQIPNSADKAAYNELPIYFYSYITAAITKNVKKTNAKLSQLPDLQIPVGYFTGQHNWMVFWEERRFEDWNPKTNKLEWIGKPFIHTEIQIKFPKGMDIGNHPNFLYQYFPGNDEAFRPNINDVKRLLGILPNNPEPLITLLVADNLKYPTFWEEVARKRVLEILDWLHQFEQQTFGAAIHLFLSACLLCSDKKARFLAADFWIKGVSLQTINSTLIGQIIGKMERREFAPLKRFTDLAQNHLFKISARHNKALELIIANILAKLPAIPIKNTTKLLILYRELLTINQSKIEDNRFLVLLDLWKDSASLKKVIRELRGFV